MFFCPNCNNSLSITQSQIESKSNIESNNNNSESESAGLTTSNKAFFKCLNCGYTREVEQGTLILSRVSEKSGPDNIIDQNKYKDMIYDMTLPHTRNYICPNKECKSQQDYSSREAVWFKPNKYVYNIVYICKACQTIW